MLPGPKHKSGLVRTEYLLSGKLTVALTLSLFLCSPAAGLDPGFYPLGYLSGTDLHSHGYGLSGNGSVAVGTSHSASGPEAFRWSSVGGMIGIGDLPGGDFNSIAFEVSADGSAIVGAGTAATASEAFRWTADTGMVGLGDLPGGPQSSAARGVSADGDVIVGRAGGNSGPEAFRWTQDQGMVGLGDLLGGGFNSDAYDVSGDGEVVVGHSNSTSGIQAFRWTAQSGMVGMGDLPGGTFHSEARGASADGSVIAGYSNSASGLQAFRWTPEEGMVGLTPGSISVAVDISADGSMIVGGSAQHGVFVWDETYGMRSVQNMLGIDLSDWQFISARGISDDGSTIIGFGRHQNGDEEAWIAVLPEPTTLALLAVGGILATHRRRVCGARARGTTPTSSVCSEGPAYVTS